MIKLIRCATSETQHREKLRYRMNANFKIQLLLLLMMPGSSVVAQSDQGKQLLSPVAPSSVNLIALVRKHDEVKLKMALESGANPNLPRDRPPVCLAAGLGDLKAVELLLRFGANANAFDRATGPALESAAISGNAKVVGALLRSGANPNLQSKNGITPLMMADNENCALLLIHAKSKIEAASNDGQRAIHAFCSEGKLGCVQLLLKSGANVNALDNLGMTPLIYTCFRNGAESVPESTRITIARLLLKAGARRNIAAKDGSTPLSEAKKSGFSKLVEVLKH